MNIEKKSSSKRSATPIAIRTWTSGQPASKRFNRRFSYYNISRPPLESEFVCLGHGEQRMGGFAEAVRSRPEKAASDADFRPK
jgi:hypothetical protein